MGIRLMRYLKNMKTAFNAASQGPVVKARKSAETIRAPAAAGRNIRSAVWGKIK